MGKDYHKGYRLQVYIPKELEDKLNIYSKIFDISKTKIVIEALYSHLDNLVIDDTAKDTLIYVKNDITSIS